NTIVKKIHWIGNEVTVVCEPAAESHVTEYSASTIVITVPLSILQRDSSKGGIVFVPDLPVSKQVAISRLVMGNVLKINLRFHERFWEEIKLWDEQAERVSFRDAGFFHYPEAPVPTWWTQLPIRAPLLVGWTGGPRADRLRTLIVREGAIADRDQANAAIVDQAIVSLTRIFNISANEVRAELQTSYIHDWHDDPFSLGAYSYLPVDGLEDQEALAQPLDDKLFFAGEATSVGHIGTVHGALQSGQRAAREILNIKRAKADT